MAPGNDPAWDPAVRDRMRRELAALLRTMRKLLGSRTGMHGGFWEPDDVMCGDIDGIANFAWVHLIKPLEQQLAATRSVITEAQEKAEAYKRELYGDAYQPVTHRD